MDAISESIEYQSVQTLKGVGPAVAGKLEKLGITSIQDVLFHLPLRYEDRTRITPIGALQSGQQAVIEGVVEHSTVRFSGRGRGRRSGRSLLCYLSDGTGGILLRFFHFSEAQKNNLADGVRLRCFGEVRASSSKLEMAHPEYRRVTEADAEIVEKTLTPVYPKTEGVHQALLRNIAEQALAKLDNDALPDWLPETLLQEKSLPDLISAIKAVHKPDPEYPIAAIEAGESPAQQRLILEELLAHHLSMMQLRSRIRRSKAIVHKVDSNQQALFLKKLEFELTAAQNKVIKEIHQDLKKEEPMLRLLQGDVGSGKTAVAACAILAVISDGYQVAVMAPTEILAEQLYENFQRWFGDDYNCVLLTGKNKGKAREEKLHAIKTAVSTVIVGTHALFQADVEFKKLSLIIIDEQHRFGVHQRLALHEKGKKNAFVPHQLIMTATPIPRSLAMTAYADLDYSVIDELPKGRKPVSTVVVSDARRQEVIDRVANACKQGEQAYWVCTLVEESEFLQCQAAEDTSAQLTRELHDIKIGLVHGRMKQDQKEDMVSRFKSGEINLLVATTVIEVGVDVPNASLMVIENAERLGLAQLHQLRGRVGRGDKQSACVLMYRAPLSSRGKERLSILRETNSGFVVAKKDLEMRGPGEVLGTRQTGLIELRIADIVRDEYLLGEVKRASSLIQANHPESISPLIQRWLGSSHRFGSV